MAKRFGIEDVSDLEDTIEALAYLILHMAKVKASEEEFEVIYYQTGLNTNEKFYKAMFNVVHPHLGDIRNMLDKDNQRNIMKFNNMEWRLSMVTGCRSR